MPIGTKAERDISPQHGAVRRDSTHQMLEATTVLAGTQEYVPLHIGVGGLIKVTGPATATEIGVSGMPDNINAFSILLQDVNGTGSDSFLLRVGPDSGVMTTD